MTDPDSARLTSTAASTAASSLVDAPLASRRGLGFAWILPAGALVLAAILGWSYFAQRGVVVEIGFEQAGGLQPGTVVRYRGARIGEVEEVVLRGDSTGVRAFLRLRPEAAHLARAGTVWWVERPRISLAGVEGLDTLIGARYVALEPGPSDGEPLHVFVGLEDPPVRIPWSDGLEIVLEARSKGGLAMGAPIRFRQIDVGVIVSIGLASDGGTVRARASIAPEYANLVREDTVFWNASGVRIDAGWIDGLEVSLDSLEALLTGAVAFATPPRGAPPALAGRTFALHERPEDDWIAWEARLPVGAAELANGRSAPEPVRAALSWKRWRLIGGRSRTSGWCLRLEDGWLGPADLLELPKGVESGAADLEVDGARFEPLARDVSAAAIQVIDDVKSTDGWPRREIRSPSAPENCLVFGDSGRGPVALDATRLAAGQGAVWTVADSATFDRDWHGAPVVARSDGKLIGLVLVDDDGARIAVDVPQQR